MIELAETSPKRYRLERYAIEPLPKDCVVDGNLNNLEAVGEALKRCHKRLGSSIKNVALALPNAAVISKKISFPPARPKKSWNCRSRPRGAQYIPFSLDEVNLDFQVLARAQQP